MRSRLVICRMGRQYGAGGRGASTKTHVAVAACPVRAYTRAPTRALPEAPHLVEREAQGGDLPVPGVGGRAGERRLCAAADEGRGGQRGAHRALLGGRALRLRRHGRAHVRALRLGPAPSGDRLHHGPGGRSRRLGHPGQRPLPEPQAEADQLPLPHRRQRNRHRPLRQVDVHRRRPEGLHGRRPPGRLRPAGRPVRAPDLLRFLLPGDVQPLPPRRGAGRLPLGTTTPASAGRTSSTSSSPRRRRRARRTTRCGCWPTTVAGGTPAGRR